MAGLTGKKILVTGGAGFIGSHLVEELLLLKAKVTVIDIHVARNSYFVEKNLHRQVNFYLLDVRDKEKVNDLFREEKFDFVIHLAAVTLVENAFLDPYKAFETNIMGTVNILEATKNMRCKGVIVASSDKAYGETTTHYTEESPLRGSNIYDVSKSSCDLIAQSYFKNFHTPVVITRSANVYGPGDQNVGRIIPDICVAVANKRVLQIRSNGKLVRDYVFVKDVVSAYIHILKNFNKGVGQAYNITSKDSYSVLDLMRKAEKILRVKIPYKILNRVNHEIEYQHLSDVRLRKFGWQSHFSLENALLETLSWYQNLL